MEEIMVENNTLKLPEMTILDGANSFDIVDIQKISKYVKMTQKNEETLEFNFKGEGYQAKVFAGGEYAIKEYSSKDDAMKIYKRGLKLNEYNCVAKTYAIVDYEDRYYIVAENMSKGTVMDATQGILFSSVSKVESFIAELKNMSKELNICLRDLHDNNIGFNDDEELKVIDFGEFIEGEEDSLQELERLYPFLYDLRKKGEIVEYAEELDRKNIYMYLDSTYNEVDVKKTFIDVITEYKKGKRTLEYIGRGDHAEVFKFKSYGEEFVLKVLSTSSFSNKNFCEEQLEVMKRVSSIYGFTKNYMIYHDEEESVLYCIQKYLNGLNAEEALKNNYDMSHSKNFMKRTLMNSIRKGVVPNDVHYDNVRVSRNGVISIFDTSYMNTNERHSMDDIKYIRLDGLIDSERVLKHSMASDWIFED